MKWEIFIQSIAQSITIFLGALLSLYQIRKLRPGTRSHLKSDLEILKLMDSSDPNYKTVKAHVDRTVKQMYRTRPKGLAQQARNIGWPFVVFFSPLAIAFITWTLYLIRSGSHGWAVLTGAVAVVALLGLLGSFLPEEPGRTKDKSAEELKQVSPNKANSADQESSS